MSAISTVWLLSQGAILASLLVTIVALVRIVIWRFRPMPLFTNRAELIALSASLVAAVIGSVWLFVGPGYSGTTYTATLSTSGAITRSVAEHSRSFYEVNGDPAVIFLFVVPVAFALLPFVFFRSRARPVVQGICAFLLSIQAGIGMSGYGLFFMPSGFIMVIACILALRGHAVQPGISPDAPAAVSRRQDRG
jgi:hypothetical protein